MRRRLSYTSYHRTAAANKTMAIITVLGKRLMLLQIVVFVGIAVLAATNGMTIMACTNKMAFSTHSFFILRHGQTDANAGGLLQGSSDFSRLTEQGREQAAELATQTSILGDSRDTQELPQLLPFQSIYVSPLTRARETLSILLTHQEVCDDTNSSRHMTATNTTPTAGGAPIIVLDNLREIDLYDWEGCHKDELNTQFPESYHAWKVGDPHNFRVSNSKTNHSMTTTDERYPLLELWERADQVWNEILQIERNTHRSDTRRATSMDHDDGPQQQQQQQPRNKNTLLVAHGSLGQALLGTAMGYNASSFRQHEFPNCGLLEIQWQIVSCHSSSGPLNPVANRWRWRWPATTSSSEWTQHNEP